MNYKVKSIAVFERQAKRLIKKYASLKTELLELVEELRKNPERGTLLVKIVLKSGYLFHLKEKAKAVVQE